MLTRLAPLTLLAPTLLALTACGEVVVTEPNQDYINAFNEHVAQVDRVDDLSPARSIDVNRSDSLTFFGSAGMAMDTNPITTSVADTSLIGDVVMTANFGTDDMTGRIDNFIGIVDGQAVREYNGALAITGGDLRVLTASGFGAQIDGQIFDADDIIDVDGSIFGNLRNEPFRSVAALSAVTAGGTDFTLNGDDAAGIITIVAERP